MSIFDIIKDAIHNRELYRSGKANKDEVRSTTIGWRPDPINKEDGFTEQDPSSPKIRAEYYKVIRSKNKKR